MKECVDFNVAQSQFAFSLLFIICIIQNNLFLECTSKYDPLDRHSVGIIWREIIQELFKLVSSILIDWF